VSKTFVFSQLSEPQPKFHSYTVEDGLPSSETYFIHQDRKGFIWICTDRGVVKFDGYNFKLFTKAIPERKGISISNTKKSGL
jgi:ligand-binding sensor domain-containing protein